MSRADRELFTAWLRQSPENVAEILRVARMDKALLRQKLRDRVGELQESNIIEGDFGGGPGQYDYHPSDAVSDKVARKRKARSLWGMAATAVLAVGMMLVGFVVLEKNREGVVETVAAEWQHVMLEDGSTVYLDARTRLKVEFTPARRVVHLYHGWAVFAVAKDKQRPFTVSTDSIDVTAVGTRFGVEVGTGVTTTVEEGIVEVTTRGKQDGSSVRLLEGQELQVQPAGTLKLSQGDIAPVDAKRKLLWVTGRVELRNTTIEEIVRQFNRRHEIQAEIEDATLATRPVDLALMQVDNVDSFIEVMESRGVAVIRDGSTLTLRASTE